jgi:hypothetical protein
VESKLKKYLSILTMSVAVVLAVMYSAANAAYDEPIHSAYNFPNMDFGAAAGVTTHKIPVPAGYKGKLRDISVAVTEVFETVTTLGIVQVGIAADLDEYGQLNIPTGAANNTVVNKTDDTDVIIEDDIAAETCIIVTLTEGTGAALTGQGYVTVYIDWYK